MTTALATAPKGPADTALNLSGGGQSAELTMAFGSGQDISNSGNPVFFRFWSLWSLFLCWRRMLPFCQWPSLSTNCPLTLKGLGHTCPSTHIPRVGPNIGHGVRHQDSFRAATSMDWNRWKRLHRSSWAWQQESQQAVLFNGNVAGLQIPELTPKHRNANMTQAALQAPCLHLSMGFFKQPTWALCPE